MSHSRTFRYNLSRTIHYLWSRVSGIPAVPYLATERKTPGEILSQRHEITCKCGWHGRGSDGEREYNVLSEDAVELKLFCKQCREYLGYIIYQNAA